MNRFTRTVGVLVGVVLMSAVAVNANAAPSPKATGGVIYENGVGELLHLEFNAQGSGPLGKGQIHFFDPVSGVQFQADVNCYVQVGNEGTLSGMVTSGDKNGIFVRVVAVDNGEPGNTDIVRITRRPEPFRCTPADPNPARHVVHGNVQIHGDAPSPAVQTVIALQSDELPGQEEL